MTYLVNIKIINDGIKTSVKIVEQCNDLWRNSDFIRIENKNLLLFLVIPPPKKISFHLNILTVDNNPKMNQRMLSDIKRPVCLHSPTTFFALMVVFPPKVNWQNTDDKANVQIWSTHP